MTEAAIRNCQLILLVLLLTGCATDSGLAPVDDRAGRPPVSDNGNWYTVHKGDTLFSIAFAHGKDYRDVARINRIQPPYTIYPGQRIRLIPVRSMTKPAKPAKPAKKPAGRNTKKATTGHKAPAVNKPSPAKIAWAWPVKGEIIRQFSPGAPRKRGIGISGKPGQAVYSAAAGKVVYSGSGLIGYGNLIIVKHSERYLSAYAHNRQVYIREGQAVKRGEKIASMGLNENNVPMLHFEIRKDGRPVNPVRYLPRN